MKNFLNWLRPRPAPDKESDKDAEARRERELQRLAKLTKTSNLPGLDQGEKKKDR